jgi:hypothetical protein
MQKMRVDFKIDRHDVASLVNPSWQYLYGKKESSKKATIERGWDPLTYKLLDHTELKKKKRMPLLLKMLTNWLLYMAKRILTLVF